MHTEIQVLVHVLKYANISVKIMPNCFTYSRLRLTFTFLILNEFSSLHQLANLTKEKAKLILIIPA